jgi:hypothetical protein
MKKDNANPKGQSAERFNAGGEKSKTHKEKPIGGNVLPEKKETC